MTRLTLDSTRVSGNPMEPKACVVVYDAATDSYDVHASSQGMSMMLPNFAAISGTPIERFACTRAMSAAASASARRPIPSIAR